MRRGVVPAVVVTALFALYLWAVLGKGVARVRTGDPFGITMGVAALVAPLVFKTTANWSSDLKERFPGVFKPPTISKESLLR